MFHESPAKQLATYEFVTIMGGVLGKYDFVPVAPGVRGMVDAFTPFMDGPFYLNVSERRQVSIDREA